MKIVEMPNRQLKFSEHRPIVQIITVLVLSSFMIMVIGMPIALLALIFKLLR
jgi:hypothetical protein